MIHGFVNCFGLFHGTLFNHLRYFVCNKFFSSTILYHYCAFNCNCHQLSNNHSKLHWIDFGIQTIIMSWYSSFSFTCSSIKSLVLVIETELSTKQWTLSLSSPNIFTNFLLQLGWIKFLHSTTSHFSKFSSYFKLSSAIEMYGPFAICVGKKRWEFECQWESKFVFHWWDFFLVWAKQISFKNHFIWTQTKSEIGAPLLL